MPPFHPRSRMCLLSFCPALGVAALPAMACDGDLFSLGDVGTACRASSSCPVPLDSSVDDSPARDDFGLSDDATPTVDAGPLSDSGSVDDSMPVDSPPLPDTGAADADSGGNMLSGS